MVTKVTTEVIEDLSITNDKIESLATTKLTGTISNDQLAGSITNSKITSLAASKLTGALPAIDGSNLTNIDPPTDYNAVGTYILRNQAGTPNTTTTNIGIAGLTGTWRCMGQINHADGSGLYATNFYFSLWVKISN